MLSTGQVHVVGKLRRSLIGAHCEIRLGLGEPVRTAAGCRRRARFPAQADGAYPVCSIALTFLGGLQRRLWQHGSLRRFLPVLGSPSPVFRSPSREETKTKWIG